MKSQEKIKKGPWALLITLILILFCILWTLPTVGILVTSFRTADAASSTGWWKAFADLKSFTLDNYNQVLFGQRFSVGNASGTATVRGATMLSAFLSSITVTLPSVIIPILIAAAAAYGFAWLSFKGRNIMFATIIALLVVPLQISLIPILRDYNKIGLNGTYLGIWLAHTGFGLPLATYMMYNYISGLPRSILESAFIDGASHFTTFVRLILPLSAPAIASFAIFQFIWVWNDMLVSLVFLSGAGAKLQVVTVRLLNMAGTRGTDWHLLTAGAFVSMILPLGVFLGLQKFFVRGLLAGSVKG
ncbi:carbohydrate ABC transporter permease [uncultured Treponema sp.]|uniref:carbohydrate ABC transporter permease n=1 Tax=uncultured Treponema sp. TaxID=162155 RepID=UPI0025D2D45D|nr:carbohydrate ABC transporter permease [uncultured Treponema sp.]